MEIAQADELPVQERTSSGRVGTLRTRTVFTGEPGSIDNFSLRIYYQNGSFASPRHHHNFDQFRYQIDGEADFARNGRMTPGVLGYFPEGAYYGPQSDRRTPSPYCNSPALAARATSAPANTTRRPRNCANSAPSTMASSAATPVPRESGPRTATKRCGNTPQGGHWFIPNRNTPTRS
jgi:hypothetical protein